MNILHVSTMINGGGGAGIAVSRLHRLFLAHRVNSNALVFSGNGESVTNIGQTRFDQIKRKLLILPDRISTLVYDKYGFFSVSLWGRDISNHPAVKAADLIYLHWINAGFLSITTIEKLLKTGKKIFWFMHDMWPMTGGCHFSLECEKYTQSCGACPLLHSHSEKDFSYYILQSKKNHWKHYNNLQLITPSAWLAKCSKDSSLFEDFPVHVIPNYLDFSIFSLLTRWKLVNSFFCLLIKN